MPEFQLDTSGSVFGLPKPWAGGGVKIDGVWTWHGLDAFTQGYIEALFFTWPEDEGDHIGGITSPGFASLAPETLDGIVRDCAAFQRDHEALLSAAYEARGYDATQAGRDFWFTRCGHGVGYWDRRELETRCRDFPRWADAINGMKSASETERDITLGDALTYWANKAGNVDAYLGDNGRVYLA